MNLTEHYARTATKCPRCGEWNKWSRIPGSEDMKRKYDKPYQCEFCHGQLKHRVKEHWIPPEHKNGHQVTL